MKVMVLLICVGFSSVGVQAQTLSDPTRPLTFDGDTTNTQPQGRQADGFPAISVSAIFISPSSKYAIINGNTLFEGQGWSNVLVTKITLNTVTLAIEDVVKTFEIQPTTIKKDVSNVL
ncbi:hypothetical protein QX776_05930 [Alteromonadaceae bacterium BrNp21-10]|nr:hypothetical protein [Alteromonadaceae bacterium BrNp21-10]